ncbi:hypothetical protein OG735_07210 [Streptomyces sp. NBC_01210]|nr:hypothetical protein OG735_07210 [Streptomyces sp. NBC_01210]
MNLAGRVPEITVRFLLHMVPPQAYAGLAVGIAVIVLLVRLRRARASG